MRELNVNDIEQVIGGVNKSCVYKGKETSHGGTVKQDDEKNYSCNNGEWELVSS